MDLLDSIASAFQHNGQNDDDLTNPEDRFEFPDTDSPVYLMGRELNAIKGDLIT